MSAALAPGRRPSWIIRAIANPHEAVSSLIPQPRDHDPAAKRLENSKWARALGGGAQLDYGIGEPDRALALPPLDQPLSNVQITPRVQERLPLAHHIRSLQRGDYDKGYTKLRSVGAVAEPAWNDRCAYLASRSDTYIILVMTKLLSNADELIVCAGTLMIERKFTRNTSLVGHIQDLEVAEGQSGLNLGLKMLEALDSVASTLGCYKTIVRTREDNEGFYRQNDYRKTGVVMTHDLTVMARQIARDLEDNFTSSYDVGPHLVAHPDGPSQTASI